MSKRPRKIKIPADIGMGYFERFIDELASESIGPDDFPSKRFIESVRVLLGRDVYRDELLTREGLNSVVVEVFKRYPLRLH
jgi:hypothetical protein